MPQLLFQLRKSLVIHSCFYVLLQIIIKIVCKQTNATNLHRHTNLSVTISNKRVV